MHQEWIAVLVRAFAETIAEALLDAAGHGNKGWYLEEDGSGKLRSVMSSMAVCILWSLSKHGDKANTQSILPML